MSVTVSGVIGNSPAAKAGIQPGDILISINGNEICDVLDYRFYESERNPVLRLSRDGGDYGVVVEKPETAEFGLTFDTYLIDKQHTCRNGCIFCFIDQMPKGLRESLYFKDDDSRLSFLFGNYITLTNLSEHEISRILQMHLSPVNISVHTTDPQLRVKMMRNPEAGRSLEIIPRLAKGGIKLNCQLVLCPGINDGDALRRTLEDLLSLDAVQCVAAVPAGLTDYRDGLPRIEPYTEQGAGEVIDIINGYGDVSVKKCGSRRVYASDEFYLKAGREIPDAGFYGDFDQLENGVGMWALMLKECREALQSAGSRPFARRRRISLATGVAAAPLMRHIVSMCEKQFRRFSCEVYPVTNNFFGSNITVAGLVTGRDLIKTLKGRDLGDELLFPAVMLRRERDLFLDGVSLDDLRTELGVPCTPVENSGEVLINALKG